MFMFAKPHSNKSNAVACFLAFSSPSGFYVLLSLNFFELFVFLSIFRSLSLSVSLYHRPLMPATAAVVGRLSS